jgi:hypothetical protein
MLMTGKGFKILMLTISCIILISSTCQRDDAGHYSIMFLNNSNLRLYVYGTSITYPDTTIQFQDLTEGGSKFIVNPNSSNETALAIRTMWEVRLDHPIQDTLMVFVFNAEVLESTPWDTVKANYIVLKRYDLSLEDLQDMDWKIIYP